VGKCIRKDCRPHRSPLIAKYAMNRAPAVGRCIRDQDAAMSGPPAVRGIDRNL